MRAEAVPLSDVRPVRMREVGGSMGSSSSSTLEIALFGSLSVQSADRLLTQFPSGKVKNLFVYLLLNRHAVHPREQLAGLFWGDEDDHRARHCLNTALWRLNRILAQSGAGSPAYLRIDAQSIGFNTASDFWLDIDEFESRCMLAEQIGPDAPDKQAALYRQAVACYRGDLLMDCYEDWCLVERERFRCLYTRTLGRLLTYYVAEGEHDAAIDCARRILVCDPLHEEVHRDLIGLYLAINRPADALRQYRTCESLLARELAVEPMPETRALLTRIIGATAQSERRVRARTGIAAVVPLTDDTLIQKLNVATARLHEAVGTFDRGRMQLQEATALIDEVRNGIGDEHAAPADAEITWPGAAERLQHAAGMLDDIGQSFGHVLGAANHGAVSGAR